MNCETCKHYRKVYKDPGPEPKWSIWTSNLTKQMYRIKKSLFETTGICRRYPNQTVVNNNYLCGEYHAD